MWKRARPDDAREAWAILYAEQAEPVNAWLRLASYGWDQPQRTIEAREKVRRSRLVAWLILGLLVGVAILSPLGLQDARARWVLGTWVLGLVLAAVLNRRGYVTAAGVTLVALISGGILAANLASPIGLTMGELPNFDAYVVPVVIAASVLPRASGFAVAAVNSLLIAGNYAWQPHNANIAQDVHLYSSATVQTISLLVRPIALCFVLAVVAYLWQRGTDRAIRRADRAEEIAELERREIDRTREIEEGVNQLLAVHVRLANGDFGARVPPLSSAPLWQIGNSLNRLTARLAHFAQVDAILDRTQQTATALADVIQRWQQGQNATLPASADTPLDPLLALLQHTAGAQRGTRSSPTGAPSAGASPSPSRGPNSGFGPSSTGASSASGPRLSGSSSPLTPYDSPWQPATPPTSDSDWGNVSDPWRPGPSAADTEGQ